MSKGPDRTNWVIIAFLVIELVIAISLFFSQRHFSRQALAISENLLDQAANLDRSAIPPDSVNLSQDILSIQKARSNLIQDQLQIVLEKQKQELFWFNVSFLGIGTALGFLSLLFLIPKEIEKKARVEVDGKIGDAIRGRSHDLRTIIQSYDFESMLCQSKRVYFWGSPESEKIRCLLEENGFNPQNIHLKEDEATKGYEILFINNLKGEVLPPKPNPNGNLPKEEFDRLHKEYNQKWEQLHAQLKEEDKNICFLYYSEAGINFPIWEIKNYGLKKRINFATNPAQIYGNLINSMKYQHRLTNP